MDAPPSSVTHAITLKGARITWAILAGIKTVENRSIRLQPGWVALHTGVGKLDARRSEEIAALCPGIPAEANLPHGALVGAMFVDRAVSVEHCRGSPAEAWASGPVCNVISKVVELDEPIEAKGALGLWKVDADILPRLQTALAGPPVRTNDASRMPPPGCTVPIPKRVRPTTADSSGGSASSSNKKSKVSSSGATGMTLDAYFVTAKAAASSTAAELAGAMGSAAATAAAPPPPPPLDGATGSAAATAAAPPPPPPLQPPHSTGATAVAAPEPRSMAMLVDRLQHMVPSVSAERAEAALEACGRDLSRAASAIRLGEL